MRSDTDCEGASESETQKENMARTAQKKMERTPRPDVIVEDQCSDQDELVHKVQNVSLADTGTVTEVLQLFYLVMVSNYRAATINQFVDQLNIYYFDIQIIALAIF